MATDYGYPTAKVVELNNEFDRLLAWAKVRTDSLYGLIIGAGVALLVFLYKRKIFVLSSKALKPAQMI